ncbi:MAG: metallo-beta-lactamase family protein [Kiritimatiellia bacterium]|jgi:metallo-beta-lactamase family protein
MAITLGFYGAAGNVTGSCYLLDTGNTRLLIDCGYYQEREFKHRNYDPFPFDAGSIDLVLLTHAHLDHCGLLPKLSRAGFTGKVLSTSASKDIAEIVMMDSARIQQEDAAYKKRRHKKEGRVSPVPYDAIYDTEDAADIASRFEIITNDKAQEIAPGVTATYYIAGHILGSSSIKLDLDIDGLKRTVLFSGDIGRWDVPILQNPTFVDDADYVICESTYGDRDHEPVADIDTKLASIINDTDRAGGNIIIPSFAIERTQDLLYRLSGLLAEDKIPPLMTFVDSPMAISVTDVFMRHPELFDKDTNDRLKDGTHPCTFAGLNMTRTAAQSKAINHIKGTCIIIAGSGMCTGGRIKHHLKSNISRPESTILFVGYQAHGTLGRLILEGLNPVRIFGQKQDVAARIERINGFSGHADRSELIQWLSAIKTQPKRIFLTHGEPEAAQSLADHLRDTKNWDVEVPTYEQVVTIE